MSRKGNFVKLDRKILTWGWYDDPATKIVFIDLLLHANFSEGEYHGEKLQKGEVVFGRKACAERNGLSERQVRTAIDHLRKSGEISTSKTTNKFSIIKVENWAFYQGQKDKSDQQNDQQATSKRPASDQQATTSKNEKNEKNGKNEKNTPPYKSPQGDDEMEAVVNQLPLELRSIVFEFIEHRKEIRHPFTVRGLRMMLKKLNELSGGDTRTATRIIEQSIANGWQGVFPLKEEKEKRSRPRNEVLEMIQKGVFDEPT